MKHVVGIDPSLNGCGVVVIDEKGRHAAKTFRSGARGRAVRSRMRRVLELVEKVIDMIEGLEIAAVCVEEYAYSKNEVGKIERVELGGVLFADLCHPSMHEGTEPFAIWEVPIGTLKVFAVGRGHTSGPRKVTKRDMIDAVHDHWGHMFGDDNQADAYALAMLAGQAVGMFKPKNSKQSEAIQTVTGREVAVPKTLETIVNSTPF